MAIHVIQRVSIDNYDAASGILQGMVVGLQADSNGRPQITAAYRAASHNALGFAADNSTATGVTMSVVDPVSPGNYVTDSGAGDDPFAYTGPAPVARPARKIHDYLNDTIANVFNWTDTGTAKRGVGVYRGGRFMTDQYISDASTSSSTADGGAAPTFAVDQALTFGGPVGHAGQVIVRTTSTDGTEVGRIINTSTGNGFLEIVAAIL
jgi:hypothetical protein